MPPSAIPAPLPAWAKALLQLAPFLVTYLHELLTHAEDLPPEPADWRRVSVKWQNPASSLTQDYAYTTYDIANITGGTLDSSWTTTDYTDCEAALDAFHTSYLGVLASGCKVLEYRWYVRRFNPYDKPEVFAKTGPPQRVTAKTFSGTGGNPMAPQVAMTVTEKTAWPKHWGRYYLPYPGQGATVDGRISSAVTNAVATAAGTLITALAAKEFYCVVPVGQVEKVPQRGLLTVSQIQVDNSFDVIRRRRFYSPTQRVLKP